MRLFFQKFAQLQAAGGICLGLATLTALILANSPFNIYYHALLKLKLSFGNLHTSFLHAINDGLMTVFFLLVSLEIKRELLQGELNTFKKAFLPTIAAVGGMLIPALFYLLINYKHPANLPGWAIPMATDIAFSLGVLSLLHQKLPSSLKIFLTALAIIDDLGAILVIAIFYTHHIGWLNLLMAAFCLIILILFNVFNVQRLAPYLIVGFPLWYFILGSGVHATIAGVLLGLIIPLYNVNKPHHSILRQTELLLHPWVVFGILPLFAFCNAGLSLAGLNFQSLFHPLPLGIMMGLLLGKPMGIVSACWLAVKAGWAKLPQKTHWQHICGIALICGIGFTMSLFIANLAFSNPMTSNLIRLGVLVGSTLSGLAGFFVLYLTQPSQQVSSI